MSDINTTISKLKDAKRNIEKKRMNLEKEKEELDKKFLNNASIDMMTANRIKKYPNNTLLFNNKMIELDNKIKNLKEHIIKLEDIKKQQTQGGKHRKSRRNRRKSIRRKIFI